MEVTLSKLNIVGHHYDLYNEPDLENYGEVSHIHRVIRKQPSKVPNWNNMVIMHEVVHAIDFVMSLGFDESQVHALGNAMQHFIQHNPKLIGDIQEGKCHGSKCGRCTKDLSELPRSKG
jgi:hypothetical protein